MTFVRNALYLTFLLSIFSCSSEIDIEGTTWEKEFAKHEKLGFFTDHCEMYQEDNNNRRAISASFTYEYNYPNIYLLAMDSSIAYSGNIENKHMALKEETQVHSQTIDSISPMTEIIAYKLID